MNSSDLHTGSEYVMKGDQGSKGYMFVRQEGEVFTFLNLANHEEIYCDEDFIALLQLKLKNINKTKLRAVIKAWLEEEMIEEDDLRAAFNLIHKI